MTNFEKAEKIYGKIDPQYKEFSWQVFEKTFTWYKICQKMDKEVQDLIREFWIRDLL